MGHVQKRVGGYLRDLKKDKTLKDKDGKRPKFARRLTDANIDKLQKYYGNAIRANVGKIDAMERACWAVFYHSCSHDGEPRHEYCPEDPKTWCPYIRAKILGRNFSHAKPRIPPDLAPFVKVCWEKLCDHELLERCTLGATQNQKESFNNLIWKYCPKTDFSGFTSVQVATLLAVLTFNKGLCSLAPLFGRLGGEVGPFCTRYLVANDAFRVRKAQVKATQESKRRRKLMHEAKIAREEQLLEKEGVTYGARLF